MCGIAGVFNFSGDARESLERAAALLDHRGPDHRDVFIRKSAALAHTRLSIIDLSGGDQPLHSPDDQLHLVANGEIYNYLELRDKYQTMGLAAKTASDCESIIQVWRDQGLDGLQYLNGMFAFALYDEGQDQLTIARDRLGIKPLFYTKTSQGLVFASEIKAILPLLESSPQINPSAFSQFLNYQFHTGRETILKGVHRLLPGEWLKVESTGEISQGFYWKLTDQKAIKIGSQEAQEEFDQIFRQVMLEHMRSDVPFGLFLSGGIDSSVLLAELAELQGGGLRTYSIGYKNTRMEDELSAADQLATNFGTDHHSVRIGRDELFGSIVRSCWAADDLMRDYASLPTLLLSHRASNDLKVVFSGEGGDEAFAGYRRYHRNFESRIKEIAFGSGGNRVRGQWQGLSGKEALGDILREQTPREPFTELWAESPPQWSWMQKSQYVDIRSALADNLLVKADRMMMSCGLEGRVPFADHRLIEFGLSLPDSIKYSEGRGKQVVRRWAETKLPKGHLQKPKRGFYVPVAEWLSGDFLAQLRTKLLANEAVGQWFDQAALESIFDIQASRGNKAREVWGVMQFAIWHYMFFENTADVPGFDENPLDWIG